jgi:sensor histidine kinase YesM
LISTQNEFSALNKALPDFIRACMTRENFRLSLIGLGLFVGLLLLYLAYAHTGSPITWQQALSVGLTQCYSWSFLGFAIFWLTKRFPIERQRWVRGALIYLGIGLAVIYLELGLDLILILITYNNTDATKSVDTSLIVMMLYFNLLTYGTVVGIGHALNFHRKYREGEIKATQLEAQLAQAQLQALKMQLHPHFLFNTLHTVAMLNLKDVKAANRMITRLSDLLRLTLDNVGVQEVSLKQELDFLRQYLEIEQIRFQDRLTVKMDIDPATLDASVPNLILQPLVENAIRHGIAKRETDGRIELLTRRGNGVLLLQVRDNGPGLLQNQPSHSNNGIGLKNTQARLERLYGAAQKMELKNAAEGGLEVSITIPFRETISSYGKNPRPHRR